MFEFLFGTGNPSRKWPAATSSELVFNWDDASLNGVVLGAPLDRLSFLGPDEDRRAFRYSELIYRSRGLGIEFSEPGRSIVAYQIVYMYPGDQAFRPFRGTVILQGQQVDLLSWNATKFLREFPDFYWKDVDDEEMILFYEISELEWQVEFSLDGRLNVVTVTNEPIMAKEKQRLAYGVTKPWPPSGGVV